MVYVTEYIERKSLLYKTKVEYGDYTINHVQGCSHGCKYPCYAFLMAKRFGRVKDFNEWCTPKLVENYSELLNEEIPKFKSKIEFVHLCFTTDPFMYGYEEITQASIDIIQTLNQNNIKCTALTKGVLPKSLSTLDKRNEFGITLVSLDEKFRYEFEPFSAEYEERIASLKYLNESGINTWVSIEPYPTPNIIEQNFDEILESIKFVDKIIFGKLNYNKLVKQYPNCDQFYDELSMKVIKFCNSNNIEYHIKKGTLSTNFE